MRDLETIDSELRLIAAVRRVCREYDGRVPSMTLVEELLDERKLPDHRPASAAHPAGQSDRDVGWPTRHRRCPLSG